MANNKFEINAEDINKEGFSSKALDQRDAGIVKKSAPQTAAAEEKSAEPEKKKMGPLKEKAVDGLIIAARMLPIVLFGFLSILIVRRAELTRPMTKIFWSPLTNNSVQTDFFNYYKMILVVFSAVLAGLAAFLTAPPMKDLRKVKIDPVVKAAAGLSGIYALAAVLSYLLSDYKAFSLTGALDRFEGLIPTLAYLFMLLYIMAVVKSEKELKFLLWPFTVIIGILGALGVGQAMGKDFFQTTFGQQIITPFVKYADGTNSWIAIATTAIKGGKTYSFTFGNRMVYQTVYNPNYVPFYLCLVLPVLAMLFLFLWDKDSDANGRGVKLLLGAGIMVIYGMCLCSFFGANSASGYFGLVTMFILALVLLRKKLLHYAKPVLVFVLVTAVIMGAVRDRWLPEVKAAAGIAINAVTDSVYADEGPQTIAFEFETAPASKRPAINKIQTEKNYVIMNINGEDFWLIIDDGLICADGDQYMLPILPIEDGSNYYFVADTRFHDYIKIGYTLRDGDPYPIIATKDYEWIFHYTENGMTFVTPSANASLVKETPIKEIPSIGFKNNPTWGTNRGMLWSRTLPLLKSRILVGEGPDCFVFAYPQEDYAAKYTIQKNPAIINNKPHNMYLQRGVETGVVSMFAYMGLILLLLVDSFRNSCRMKGYAKLAEHLGTGICMGVAAFAVTGMLNDTTICTGPIFYTMMGMGFACNRIAERADLQKEETPAPDTQPAGEVA